jgi:hypothetical protein
MPRFLHDRLPVLMLFLNKDLMVGGKIIVYCRWCTILVRKMCERERFQKELDTMVPHGLLCTPNYTVLDCYDQCIVEYKVSESFRNEGWRIDRVWHHIFE